MNEKTIPDIIVGRLPLYLRALQHMVVENRRTASSQELSERLGISAAQIRKDLSQFGEFGKQGTGYEISNLIQELLKILKVDKTWDIVVIGAGDIGSAIARNLDFTDRGYHVSMVFDNDPQKINTMVGPFMVKDSRSIIDTIQKAGIKLALIAVPVVQAQEVADQLVKAGVKAILNYAPISINVPPDVRVQYVDPIVHLQRMSYYL
jgi:redox-sensing transcriptional repressor